MDITLLRGTMHCCSTESRTKPDFNNLGLHPDTCFGTMSSATVQFWVFCFCFFFCFLPVILGLLGLTREEQPRARLKETPMLSTLQETAFGARRNSWSTRVHRVWVCLVPPAFNTLSSQIFKDPHYSPSSKPSPFWVQYNLLGLALQKQNVDHCWNGVMAHGGLCTSFCLFGRNLYCLTCSRTKGCGEGDKPYNPGHLMALLFQGLTPSYLFSLPGGFPTSSLLTRILLDHQGSLQNHLLYEADPDARVWL